MKKEVVKDQELDLSVLTKNQSSDDVVNSLKQQHLEMKKQVKNKGKGLHFLYKCVKISYVVMKRDGPLSRSAL